MIGELSVYWWRHAGATVVVAEGTLDSVSYGDLRVAVVKAAAELPRAVIVDLDRTGVAHPTALAQFPAVASEIAMWPGVPLLIAVANEANHRIVTEWCQRWQVTAERAVDVLRVALELVDNTIKHTYGPPTIRVEMRLGMLTVAVYDGDPEPVHLIEPGTDPVTGVEHGLTAIARACPALGAARGPSRAARWSGRSCDGQTRPVTMTNPTRVG